MGAFPIPETCSRYSEMVGISDRVEPVIMMGVGEVSCILRISADIAQCSIRTTTDRICRQQRQCNKVPKPCVCWSHPINATRSKSCLGTCFGIFSFNTALKPPSGHEACRRRIRIRGEEGLGDSGIAKSKLCKLCSHGSQSEIHVHRCGH